MEPNANTVASVTSIAMMMASIRPIMRPVVLPASIAWTCRSFTTRDGMRPVPLSRLCSRCACIAVRTLRIGAQCKTKIFRTTVLIFGMVCCRPSRNGVIPPFLFLPSSACHLTSWYVRSMLAGFDAPRHRSSQIPTSNTTPLGASVVNALASGVWILPFRSHGACPAPPRFPRRSAPAC